MKAGKWEFKVDGPYPTVLGYLYRDGKEVCGVIHHKDFRDLQSVIGQAIGETRKLLPPHRKSEVD